MRFQRISCMVVLFVTVLVLGTAVAEQAYYVQSMKAKMMSAPSFKSRVVAEVAKGGMVSLLAREGSWTRVKHGLYEGYVPMLLLSPTPPLDRQGLIKGEDQALGTSIRRRASTYTSAAAARGLAADDRRRLSAQEKADYASLEKMEAFSVTPDEVSKFAERNAL